MIKIASEKYWRSGVSVNKSEDMVRVVLDMELWEWRELRKNLSLQPTSIPANTD